MTADERKFHSGKTLGHDDFKAELMKEAPGVLMVNNAVPPGVLVVEKFLPAELCQGLIQRASATEGNTAGVLSADPGGAVQARNVDTRKVEHFTLDHFGDDLERITRAAYTEFLTRHYRAVFEWYEKPVVLRYREKGEYTAHADAYNWDDADKRWRRVANRDFSLLVYLNENYQGGELEFKYLNFRLKPGAGMLLAFPSDWRYAHAALPVAEGVKYSIVSFGAVKGGPRLDAPPPPNAIMV